MLKIVLGCASLALPSLSYASTGNDFSHQPVGYIVLALFLLT